MKMALSVSHREGATGAPMAAHRPGGARVLGSLGRVEAARLASHPAVLAGVAGAVALFAAKTRSSVGRWWVDDALLGTALLLVGVAALVAGHLATSRPRRDGMAALYDSFPTSAARRTGGHLVALVAPVALSAVLVAAAIVWLDAQGAIGAPRAAVLGGGLAVVAFLGALGVALGRWAPQAWAGLLAAVVVGLLEVDLVVPSFDAPLRLGQGVAWLAPWHQALVSGELPGPLPGLPPAGAHVVELVGVALLLAAGALLSRQWRGRRVVAGGIAACLVAAAVGWAGWSETRPISLAELDGVVAMATQPAAHESCRVQGGVSYCAYPAYREWVKLWAVPVGGVLAHLPRRPSRRLVVRQVVGSALFCSPSLVGAQAAFCVGSTPTTARGQKIAGLAAHLAAFQAGLGTDPGLVPGSARPPVYVGLNWGQDATLGPTQLNLALDTAYWALGLPTTGQTVHAQGGTSEVSCLPVGQAREAVALWLAASATPGARAALLSEVSGAALGGSAPYGNGRSSVATFALGSSFDTVQPLQTTGRATLLAAAMARLPVGRVETVLAAHWSTWTNWRTSDAALAVALGLRLPPAPPARSFAPHGATGANQITQVSPAVTRPVCH
ncbi:MAG: hypothetical protein ACYDH5_15650 [Acidimicrobiales bacterium]